MNDPWPEVPGVRAEVLVDGTVGEVRLDHPECVAVHPDGSVWCGGENGQIYRIEQGRIEQVATTGGFCLGVAFDHDGNLLVCDLAHAAVMRMDGRTGRVERFADGVPGHRFVTPNHLVVDGTGGIYVSDSNVAHRPGPGVVRFGPDGTGTLWDAGPFDFANGLALDEPGGTLYVAETWSNAVTAVAIRPDGSAGPRRRFATLPGILPDGLTLDTEGRLYVGCYEPSQVLRVEADGTVHTVLSDPSAHLLCHPTNLAFAGRTLITANLGRWHLTAIDVPDTAGAARAGRASAGEEGRRP